MKSKINAFTSIIKIFFLINILLVFIWSIQIQLKIKVVKKRQNVWTDQAQIRQLTTPIWVWVWGKVNLPRKICRPLSFLKKYQIRQKNPRKFSLHNTMKKAKLKVLQKMGRKRPKSLVMYNCFTKITISVNLITYE